LLSGAPFLVGRAIEFDAPLALAFATRRDSPVVPGCRACRVRPRVIKRAAAPRVLCSARVMLSLGIVATTTRSASLVITRDLDSRLVPRASRSRDLPHPPLRPLHCCAPASTLPAGRHPCRSGRTTHGNAVSCSAWRSRKACAGVLALCHRGCWASRPCPRAYPHRKRDRSRVPSLQRFLAAFNGSMDPSDSLPAPHDFSSRLIRAVFARRGPPGRVSPVPHRPFVACRRPYPGEAQRPFRNRSAVHGLRRDMSGSALPNTFRLIM